MARPPTLGRLPGDLLGTVFAFLARVDVGRLTAVSRALWRLVHGSPTLAAALPHHYRDHNVAYRQHGALLGTSGPPDPWAMNLSAVTADHTRLLVGKGGRLYTYRLPLSPTAAPEDEVVVDPKGSITQIMIGSLGGVEVVVAVTTERRVVALRADDLAAPPLLAVINHDSTWSIACHSLTGQLAVGSNAFEIVTFRFGAAPLLNPLPPPTILRGHRHNIPALAFSPSGAFLLSTSIDGTLRLWEVATGAHWTLMRHPLPRDHDPDDQEHWGWALAWWPVDDVEVTWRDDSVVDPVISNRRAFRQTAQRLSRIISGGFATLAHALRTGRSPLQGLPAAAVRELTDNFLLVATTDRLSLLRYGPTGMEIAATVNVTADTLRHSGARPAHPRRLALLCPLPGLSAVAVSTQGNGVLVIYRIFREHTGAFQFQLQLVMELARRVSLPNRGLAGLACVPLPGPQRGEGAAYMLYATNYDMQAFPVHISATRPHLSDDFDRSLPPVVGPPAAPPRVIDLSWRFRGGAAVYLDDLRDDTAGSDPLSVAEEDEGMEDSDDEEEGEEMVADSDSMPDVPMPD